MATAREKLYDEVVALTEAAPGDDAEPVIRKIMARYRVQTKPGVTIPDGTTARDALGDRLLALWRERPADLHAKLGSAIDEFRMQVKQKGAPAAKAPKKAATPPAPAPAPQPVVKAAPPPQPVAPKEPEVRARPDVAPAPPAGNGHGSDDRPRRTVEPVGGGPRRKGRSRGECPKCHSMGVVLARSYAGDEYYSCIYCGWQAYKPADESDPTASLAVKLLGQSAPEK